MWSNLTEVLINNNNTTRMFLDSSISVRFRTRDRDGIILHVQGTDIITFVSLQVRLKRIFYVHNRTCVQTVMTRNLKPESFLKHCLLLVLIGLLDSVDAVYSEYDNVHLVRILFDYIFLHVLYTSVCCFWFCRFFY